MQSLKCKYKKLAHINMYPLLHTQFANPCFGVRAKGLPCYKFCVKIKVKAKEKKVFTLIE